MGVTPAQWQLDDAPSSRFFSVDSTGLASHSLPPLKMKHGFEPGAFFLPCHAAHAPSPRRTHRHKHNVKMTCLELADGGVRLHAQLDHVKYVVIERAHLQVSRSHTASLHDLATRGAWQAT